MHENSLTKKINQIIINLKKKNNQDLSVFNGREERP